MLREIDVNVLNKSNVDKFTENENVLSFCAIFFAIVFVTSYCRNVF